MSQTAQSQPPATEHAHTNRLIDETSPYLLQHAHNPVDWYPWCDEAFTAAREQNKLIFLSVGYSTCYWCHVMERESFESDDVAAIMNERYVCIKVDREERPDVDDIYMTATQLMTRHGGWPMSVWIEPKTLKPFTAGTYLPREQFKRALHQMADVWSQQPDQVAQRAELVAGEVQRVLASATPLAPDRLTNAIVDEAVAGLMRAYDATHAGFGSAPKFPQPVYLELLLGAAWENDQARNAVLHTLNRMATGGMYDQIGGGFHRYSTDAKWLVPHFEKMLYDNGQLASVYALAYERTKDPYYEEIVRETLDYVLRNMTGTSGAFYSAQDAEVDAREGLNYLWLPDQIRPALTQAGLEDNIDFALQVYGLDKGTNFQDPHHPEDGPKNVMYLVDRPDALAQRMGVELTDFNARIKRVNEALLDVRNQRKQPGTDDKVLTAWNGLMITGFADAGRILSDLQYVDAAINSAEFILKNMTTTDDGLLRSYRDGTSRIGAFFEDYALFIEGLLALHESTRDTQWLQYAVEFTNAAESRFWDETSGAYFDTLADQPDLFVRTKSVNDGAMPSGNGTMVNNLLELYEQTHNDAYLARAVDMLTAMSDAMLRAPVSTARSTLALHRVLANHPDAFKRQEQPAPSAPGRLNVSPVTITLDTTSIPQSQDRPQTINVTLSCENGYHINAHEPGTADVVPLSIKLEGVSGIEATVEYPTGEPYTGPIADVPLRVHHGRVVVPVVLRRVGDLAGEPRLRITYQVCTDTACLRPTTETIAFTFESDSGD